MQPILFQIMDHFQNDVVVMERCCRCIRFAIRTLSKSGVYLLPTLIEKVNSEEFSFMSFFYYNNNMICFNF